jgi:hypothetical protein
MKATVYVVVTYHGYHGDEVQVFGSESEAQAYVLEYAQDYWPTSELGSMPRSYDELCERWGDHDLWGSTDSRWELEERQVEVPDLTPSAPER